MAGDGYVTGRGQWIIRWLWPTYPLMTVRAMAQSWLKGQGVGLSGN